MKSRQIQIASRRVPARFGVRTMYGVAASRMAAVSRAGNLHLTA